MRVDEITLHPRDNAMLVATHGRAIWILDHLEPIQEYAAAQAAATDAKLFTPPPPRCWRTEDDRNDEFWGDQTFFGENPPGAAIISWLNKKQVGEVKLKITDAAGREVRDISGTPLANSNKAGIQIGVLGSARAAERRRRRKVAAEGQDRQEGQEGQDRQDGQDKGRRDLGQRQSLPRRARSAPVVPSRPPAVEAADSAADQT